MEEITAQMLVKARYGGSLNDMAVYMNLAIQAGAVLVAGIVLWRASTALHMRKKAERERNAYFKTPYSKGWKR